MKLQQRSWFWLLFKSSLKDTAPKKPFKVSHVFLYRYNGDLLLKLPSWYASPRDIPDTFIVHHLESVTLQGTYLIFMKVLKMGVNIVLTDVDTVLQGVEWSPSVRLSDFSFFPIILWWLFYVYPCWSWLWTSNGQKLSQTKIWFQPPPHQLHELPWQSPRIFSLLLTSTRKHCL